MTWIHQGGPHLVSSVDMVWTALMNSICSQCFLPLTWCGPPWWIRYVTSVLFRWHGCGPLWWIRYVTRCQRKETLVTYRIHQRGPRHVKGRKHWLHIEFIREVHIMSTEENTGYISNWSQRSTSCQRKKNTGYISNSSERSTSCQRKKTLVTICGANSSERSTSCQRKKTLVTYRIHQRGPHHVNGRKHWLHNEFIREVHIMSTEENTGYITNSSEWSTPCQRKKTLVTYRFHQNGPHHVNGRKHWLHIEFIREVHVMPTEENTGYISNSTERSNSCQRKKTLATYRFHQRGPHLFSSVDMNWTSLLNSICNQCFLPLAWRGPLWWIRYVTSVFFRWHGVDLSDEIDM